MSVSLARECADADVWVLLDAGLPIVGEWDPDNRLSNGGENLKLSFGAGISVIEFEYDDRAPWPSEADGDGYSLTLDQPASSSPQDHSDPHAWRASRLLGGSPGRGDGIDFASWASSVGLPEGAAPEDDPEGDGLNHLLEYALASDPLVPSSADAPSASVQLLTIGEDTGAYLTLTFRRQIGAADLSYAVEFSDDMLSWSEAGG